MSKVYFTDLRTKPKRNLLDKISDLMNRVKLDTKIKANDLTAVKIHFGELGNAAYLRPIYLRAIVDKIKELKAKPFLTDTNTLYAGSRSNSIDHLITAVRNGFDYSCVECPIIIADGLRGMNGVKIPIKNGILDEVSIAKEIVEADSIVVATHFKAHELTGFGGTLKNLGMGCASREGKLTQHSKVAPGITVETCTGCKTCFEYCPAHAISFNSRKAHIDGKKCIGCGQCIHVCPVHAIAVVWDQASDDLQKRMVEHALGALKGKLKKAVYINFLMQISPACDCYPNNDAPIVRDIGILASDDPVAIDTASCDMVNDEESLPNTAIKHHLGKGEDKWRAIYPSVDWNVQLDHAEGLGMGTRDYTILKI